MKKLSLIFLTVLMLAIGLSCEHKQKTVIVIKDDNHYLKIEYAGTIVFNNDNTGLLHISPNGYFKCKDEENKLTAEADKSGRLVYEVNSDEPTTALNENSKALLMKAVKEIERQRVNRRS